MVIKVGDVGVAYNLMHLDEGNILAPILCMSPSQSGLDLSFARGQGEYNCMWRCPRPGLNPSGLVNSRSAAVHRGENFVS